MTPPNNQPREFWIGTMNVDGDTYLAAFSEPDLNEDLIHVREVLEPRPAEEVDVDVDELARTYRIDHTYADERGGSEYVDMIKETAYKAGYEAAKNGK